jgi:tetratricopeptide (TPR) repeat protein
MTREVAAMTAFAEGRRDAALAILQEAARAELQLPAPLGLPVPIKPAPELLGEMLIDAGRPGDAPPFFRQALERNANRSLSVLGLARAAAASGDAAGAQEHYRQLLVNFSAADPELAVLAEARSARAAAPATTASSTALPRAVFFTASAGALAALAAAVFVVRLRTRSARACKKNGPPKRARAGRA